MSNEKNMTSEESLALITKMIRHAKEDYYSTGATAILWGTTISICALVQFLQYRFHFSLPFDIYWLTFVAGVLQALIVWKENKRKKVKHHEESSMKFVWSAYIISLVLLIFILNIIFPAWSPVHDEYVAFKGSKPSFVLSEYTSAFFLILYGIPTFITGGIFKFKPMIMGGIICWLGCILSLFTSLDIDFLLTAAAAIFAWLIPGLIMQKEYRESKSQAKEIAHV